MTSYDLRAQTISLLASERGLAPEVLRGSDRLLQDLGMDGDDAVEFFESVHRQFGTDLSHLYENWSAHFGAEAAPWFWFIAIFVGGVVPLSAGAAGLQWFWAFSLCSISAAASIWLTWKMGNRLRPITVDDLVAAVEAGRWPLKE